MNSLIKGLVITLIIGGSSASILSSISSNVKNIVKKTEELPSKVSSLVEGASNKVSGILDSFHDNSALDIIGAIQKLSSAKNEEVASILGLVNVTLPKDGQLDLKSVLQKISSKNFDLYDILSLLNVNLTDAVHNLFSLVQKIISDVNFTEYLNSLTAKTTEDGELDFEGLAKKYIGTVEEYEVTTEDGYILTLFNIPGDGEVVLLSHAFFGSSDDFIIRGKTSLVYMLVQAGYDVWVMNYRGNRYSRSHTELNPDTDDKFWDYSVHELGYYDLKAVIDTILEETAKEQLSVIGHSEGSAAVFVLTSTIPEYNEKIKIFVALSPVCYLSNPSFALKTLVSSGPILNELLQATGVEEVLGFGSLTRNLIQRVCSQGALGYNVCLKLGLGAISGYHSENLDQDFFLSVLGHFPAGTSRKNLIHYMQIGSSGNFAQYNYGSGNNDKYGSETPPEYDFSKVTCKVVLFAGENDNILGIEDAERVRDQLPNLGGYFVVEDKVFNNVDFLYGQNANKVLYPKVIAQLE